jgi:hypothetical protein
MSTEFFRKYIEIVEEAQKPLNESFLPASGATWDDVMEQVYIRQAIEAGLKSANENELIEVDEVRRRFGLAV